MPNKIKLIRKLKKAYPAGSKKVRVNAKAQDGAIPNEAFKNRFEPMAKTKIPIK